MAENNSRVGRPCHAGSIDELAFTKGEELAAHEASEARPRDEAQQYSERNCVAANGPSENGTENQAGDDDDDIGHSHEKAVEPAAQEPSERPHDHTDNGCKSADEGHNGE